MMIQMTKRAGFSFVLALTLLASTAHAASFNVSPLRLTLAPGAKTASLALTNQGEEPVSVQTELLAWSQKDGADVLTPSSDIIVSPPIFKIAPGATQTVRVGLLRPVDAAREATYRLFLKEVPPPPKPGQQGVNVVMRLGVPVFVAVPGRTKPLLSWHAERGQKGELTLTLANSGNAHVQLISYDLREAGGGVIAEQSLSGYVLAGQTRSWPIKPSRPWSGDQLTLNARTDSGDVSVALTLK